MNTASNTSRVLAAALAMVCSAGLLSAIAAQLDPARLHASSEVVVLEPVVVKAPLQSAAAAGQPRSATN
jgi:hypothetical protein